MKRCLPVECNELERLSCGRLVSARLDTVRDEDKRSRVIYSRNDEMNRREMLTDLQDLRQV